VSEKPSVYVNADVEAHVRIASRSVAASTTFRSRSRTSFGNAGVHGEVAGREVGTMSQKNLTAMIFSQTQWMREHGGDLAGYRRYYTREDLDPRAIYEADLSYLATLIVKQAEVVASELKGVLS
jgi:hypothetical protein